MAAPLGALLLQATLGSAPGARFPPGRQLVQLEATMFACSIFSQPTVECEQRILQRRLEDMLRNSTARAAWEAGGKGFCIWLAAAWAVGCYFCGSAACWVRCYYTNQAP